MKPVKTPHENSSLENEPREEEIKFHNEAHRKNYEKVMEAQSDSRQPKDLKIMIEQMKKNSKD